MKIRENSKKFNIFLDFSRCSFIVIRPNNDIKTHKKLRKILGIQPIYNYILDIQTAQDDSKFVFQELGFETRLPKDHESSKTNKKSLEDYFKDQGF